jgi:PLP dependent protein
VRGAGDPELAARLARLRARVAAAARRVGRAPEEVTLVGVAKTQPAGAVVAAVEAGLAHVGESFAQEARAKIPAVAAALAERGLPAPCWHFVGRLQRNKAARVAEWFDAVESVDRASLAEALEHRVAQLGRPPLEVLLQVNLSGEPQKGGVAPEVLAALLAEVAGHSHLRVVGLMTVPRAAEDPEEGRPVFAQLRALRDALSAGPGGDTLRELSMGMSGDFEVAVEEGATRVRVGSALFGSRSPR